MPDRSADDKRRIGYVLKVFPRVSETFVINEIRALQALETPLHTFSLHHPPQAVPHAILNDLHRPVRYIEDVEDPGDDVVRRASHRLQRGFGIEPEARPRYLPRKYVRLAVCLGGLADRLGVSHLHAHFASRAGHVAALAAGLNGIPYSVTAHAKDIYHQDVDRDLLRWKIANAAFIVTVTDYNLRHLRDLVDDIPGAGERIVRIYNGIELSRFQPTTPPEGGTPLILAVGRLVEKKGFPVLIESCRLLRERGRDFRCEIVGGGPLEGELRDRIATAGLSEHVRLAGVLSTEAVAARMQAASLLALPCVVGEDGNVDALPTVLLEAMASARPTVSTRLSGIPEIIADGETGFLTPPGDPRAFADALGHLIDRPALGAAMGRAGRRRAERLFDLRANAARVRRLFKGHGLAGMADAG